MRLYKQATVRRIAVMCLMSLAFIAFIALGAVSVASAQPGTSAATTAQVSVKPTRQFTVARKGILDLSKAPTIKPGDAPTSGPPPTFEPQTSQQRAAYEANARKGIGVPPAPAVKRPTTTAPGFASNFVGGGIIPLLTKQFDGLNSTQSGNAAVPDVTIATDLSYVMEGVSNAVGIYRASTGALAYGPYSADTFFAPLKIPGDTFGRPQMYYDVMRDRWIVLWMEYTAVGNSYQSYADIAISTSNSPTQPTPGGQYYEYRIPTTDFATGEWCYQASLGVEYYTLTLGCTILTSGNSYLTNWVVILQKGPMLTGANTVSFLWDSAIKTDVFLCGADPCPAFYVSPATEEGVQDAEFLVGTGSGYGGTHDHIYLCALTNLANIAAQTPTMACYFTPFPSYSDPIAPVQAGGALQPERGMKQIYYKAGHLFLALTSGFSGPADGVIWAELTPRLQPSLGNSVYENSGVLSWGANQYFFAPALIGSDEGDVALVVNYSNNTGGPTIMYTGRKASDQANMMAHGTDNANLVPISSATHPSGAWDGASACAIALNSVTRGTLWCVGEYQGSVPDPGWNTRIFSLRVE
jgi:hypothetical protein